MKIKTKKSDYCTVTARKKYRRKKPLRTIKPLRWLMKTFAGRDLKATSFTYTTSGMERIRDDEPVLILMNHSSFIDLEIAATVFYPRPLSIVCEADGFVGKEWLMRHIGCIPTHKFNNDLPLVRDLIYSVRTLKTSILMYPEASYSFDGTSPTPLPESLGKLIKLLKVPVVIVSTKGAFHRDPLYNKLKKRGVKVSAVCSLVLERDDIEKKTSDEINELLKPYFTFDHFKWQKDEGVIIDEDFRAEGLESVLYKCPVCFKEGKMKTSGEDIECSACGEKWHMDEDGSLNGPIFSHIPDWFKWEREETEKEIEKGEYKLEVPVKILLQVDMSSIYDVGDGTLVHTLLGFHLTSHDGAIDFRTSALDNYSLASDIYWYEKGDMISIGDDDRIFYLFPKEGYNVVSKARFAQEKIYRMEKEKLKVR